MRLLSTFNEETIMSRTRRLPRKNAGNPSFIPKKTALAMAVGLALSSQVPSAEAAIYVVINSNLSGAGSFAQALSDANEVSDPDEISFLSGQTFNLTLANGVTISNPVFIDGSSATVTIKTDNNCESGCTDLLTISSSGHVTITGLTLDSGHASYNQSLIEHSGTGILTIDSCNLLNTVGRTTAGNGGAINNTNGHLEIHNSVINGQQASGNGGAIAITANVQLIMQNSGISSNTSSGDGGGIYLADTDTVTIENSTFSSNSAGAGKGGGIYYSPFDLVGLPEAITITSSTLSGNIAGSGGGLYVSLSGNDFANVIINNSVFFENQAAGIDIGGGVAVESTGTAAQLGFEIDSNLFDHNTALNRGGAIGIMGNSVLSAVINNTSITNNTVNEASAVDTGGGGVYMSGDQASLIMVNSTVDGNVNTGSAPSGGGGIYLNSDSSGYGLTAYLLNDTITNNASSDATGQGGGIVAAFAAGHNRLRLINSIVAQNNASTGPDILSEDTEISYSLIGNDSGANLTDLSMGHNIVGTTGALANPMLAAIADNGGAKVGVAGDVPLPTRKVRKGSPVINAADETSSDFGITSPPINDQRGDGFDRIRGSGLEMGAIEYIGVPSNDDDDDNNDDTDNSGGGGGGGGTADFALLLSLSGLLSVRRRRN
jgi:parallel beta-helix repeat protein